MAMPNLLEIQKKSYQWFLDTGLREVFADVASISDYAGNLELSFIDFSMNEQPKYDVEECKARDLRGHAAAPLGHTVDLALLDIVTGLHKAARHDLGNEDGSLAAHTHQQRTFHVGHITFPPFR